MHSSIISRVSFTFKVCPFSPCGCLGPFFTIVERSHVFNLRAAEKEIFLLRWFQDLPAEACKSGQIYLSCSAEVIPETSSCLQCHRVQFVLRNRSSVENLDKKRLHCLCAYYITWLVKTQKSTTEWSFVKVVVLKLTIVIWDRNGPIINLDASARSASLIFLFHQRFLLLQNVYFLIFFFLKWTGLDPMPLPSRGPCPKNTYNAMKLQQSSPWTR